VGIVRFLFLGKDGGVNGEPTPGWLPRALHRSVSAAVRVALGGFWRHAPADLSLGLTELGASDLRSTSIDGLRWYLRRTVEVAVELRESYPALERPYRRRRRQLVALAVTLTEGRLFVSCQRILGAEDAPVSFARLAAPLAAAAAGLCHRLLLQFVTFGATTAVRSIDDASLRVVLLSLAIADRLVQKIDRTADAADAERRLWDRLEVSRNGTAAEEASALSEARQEVRWACPTRVSTLILLSTLRDNNSGTYRHPALSRKFGPTIVSEMLARIHRETYEELLRYSLRELVYELGLYASQTRADERSFLQNWKSIRAYRTARPAGLDWFAASFFEMIFDLAVAALGRRPAPRKASYVPNPG
jgi:hypothetical protein